ncbi:sodium-coupled monocarboxylate transporter 1-like [Oratosquilla oratoria]|uniref:sodium-coupled monocarboxylate transporter 1-like n=1 Tax=Oratosquilla oratoria TaxID=337810 RepID=UPI003F777192
MDDRQMEFQIVDYVVCIGTLAVCVAIGAFFTFKANKTTEDYLLGQRSMSPGAVTLSLLTTFITASSFLGLSAETYGHGMKITASFIGCFVGISLAANLLLPVFYPLKLVSIYEYIERRFKCSLLTSLLIILYLVMTTFVLGVFLYAPAMALASTTPLPTDTSIYICGIVCALYSSLGGLKAVVWTDVFQMLIMATGLVAIIIIGVNDAGGVARVWDLSSQGGRTQMLDMSLSLYKRHTFWGVGFVGLTNWLGIYGVTQANLQRTCSVDSLAKAQRMLYFNAVGQIVVQLSITFAGLCAYATYFNCDPMATGDIKTMDQILPYFVMDKMGHIYGIPGLFVAALFCGSLSTLSSFIHSLTAVIWKVVSRLSFFKNASEFKATSFQKMISLCLGAWMVVMALLASKIGGIFQLIVTIIGVIVGSKLGVYLLAVLVPWCSKRGALLGFLSAAVFVLSMTVGRLLYVPPWPKLPFRSDGCNMTIPSEVHINGTTLSNTDYLAYNISNTTSSAILDDKSVAAIDVSPADSIDDDSENTGSIFAWFYEISYIWTGTLGCTVCIIVGLLVTLCECKCCPRYSPIVEPELLHPWWRSRLRRGGVDSDGKKKNLSVGTDEYSLALRSSSSRECEDSTEASMPLKTTP